ncbi:unnamed protein product [Rhizophagus irregularis]|nr:unnamed protein product [Rhizophagus irregularis]
MVLKARAIFDCAADDDQELSFKENAIIVDIVESTDKGWFEGTLEGSKIRGLFPDNYVEFFEVEEKQLKPPPKLPPRKLSNDTNGVIENSTPSFNKKSSDDPVNNSGITETLPEPKKLSAAKFAIFEQSNNNNNNNLKPQKAPPIIKPKPKIYPANTETSTRSVGSNLVEQEHEVSTPSISVVKMKSMLERNAKESKESKESTPLPSQNSIKPITPLKPTNILPIAPKPGKLAPLLPSRPLSTNFEATDKKPPLPPRRQSNVPSISSVNSNNDAPPPTPPRPSSNNATTKARSDVQDVAGETAKQGVSVGIAQLKDDLNRSKYGNKKIPGQNALFNKVEKEAQNIANDQAKKKVGETFDKNMNEIQNKSTSKPLAPSRSNNIINDQISPKARPPLPTRNNDIKIPRRPTSHNNPFGENDLSKGIPSDVKKRYEIIYNANKDDDGYIDGAVVKEIYLRSRLDNKTLFKIWNLLDDDEDGRLSRNEFCVGMFLIDERLKGHPVPNKLPHELLNN